MNVYRLSSSLARVALAGLRRPVLAHNRFVIRGVASSNTEGTSFASGPKDSEGPAELNASDFSIDNVDDNVSSVVESALKEDAKVLADFPGNVSPLSDMKEFASHNLSFERECPEGEEPSTSGYVSSSLPQVDENAANQRTIYSSGWPYSSTADEICSFFADCGEIENVDIPLTQEGRTRGFAFVRFIDESSLESALSKDGNNFQGRYIKVAPRSASSSSRQNHPAKPIGLKPHGCRTVFVGNLSWNTVESNLENAFSSCGSIHSVRLMRDNEGRSRGFGWVEFHSTDSVDAAIKLIGSMVDGREIRVDYANERERKPGFAQRGRQRQGYRSNGSQVNKAGSHENDFAEPPSYRDFY